MSHIERILFLVAVVILLLIVVRLKYREYSKKRQQKKRFQRGDMLEAQAKSLLEKKGYFITDEQAIFFHNYKVNGELKRSKLIVDYIAERKGKKYIVEVKSGKSAISLKDKNSRRQLLEYDFVIENDGVVLLDMENRNMQLVEFQPKAEKKENLVLKLIMIMASVGILLPFWSLKIIISLLLVGIWFYPEISKNIIKKLIGVY